MHTATLIKYLEQKLLAFVSHTSLQIPPNDRTTDLLLIED